LYQEDSKFDLAGDIMQVRDDVSPRNNVQMDPLDGSWFLSLSDYIVIDMFNPKSRDMNVYSAKSAKGDAIKSTKMHGTKLGRHPTWRCVLLTPM
jgi:hypothetical protein